MAPLELKETICSAEQSHSTFFKNMKPAVDEAADDVRQHERNGDQAI